MSLARRSCVGFFLLGISACGGHSSAPQAPPPAKEPIASRPPKVYIDSARLDQSKLPIKPDSATTPPPAPPEHPRVAPPEAAFQRGWMPLASTGVDAFRRAHPTADGRGVLIAILDTGIDPSAPGLGKTSTGDRKILDLRDFSGEGSVALERVVPKGDTVQVAGHRLVGFGRVAALNAAGPYYGGTLQEIPLGEAPAADLNGNGTVGDTLPVIVTRATDGWVLFADTDGDGSLANERAVHDFLQGYDTFGWAARGRQPPVAVAVNFGDSGTPPKLDLFVDTGNHGTFVSGVAAAHDLYGVAGFDGVAPGAQLIGLKIANNAQGGISVTGSMLRAMDYAIRFAERRRLPLVLNMSFGVGNEIEGQARIDHLVDSVLAAHPDLVFCVSAGNDGPGLSTMGFPGSAERVLTVGATIPGTFLRQSAGPIPADQIAFFSSRGGELAKPDVLAPGFAYSSVPRYDAGGEVKQGTSFSSPYVAGIAALLRSQLKQAGVEADARTIKQALMVTARPQGDLPFIDEGAGLPDVESAWRWLEGRRTVPEVDVKSVGNGDDAAYRDRGLGSARDTVQRFAITRPGAKGRTTYTLRSSVPWLLAPRRMTLKGATDTVTLRYAAAGLKTPGLHTGVVSGWTADTMLGPAFRLVNTVIVPHPLASAEVLADARLEAGENRRAFFVADSARPFLVRVSTPSALQTALTMLYEPGGRPYRDRPPPREQQAGADSAAAVFWVDARDAQAGVYEVDALALPNAGATVSVHVEQSPFRLHAGRDGDAATGELTNVSSQAREAEVAYVLVGGEQSRAVDARGSTPVRIPFAAPAWVREVDVDVAMDPAQWGRFTDFGVSLVDPVGRIVEKEPMNYAVSRLKSALPEKHGDLPLEVWLSPGLADPGSVEAWSARVSVRLYAGAPSPLESDGQPSASVSVEPRASKTVRFTLGQPPWSLPQGFDPLGVLVVHSGGDVWTRETRLGTSTAR
jgi:subtilisin family serine protease